MRCPYCNSDKTKVIDKRPSEDSNRRRRECSDCSKRFTTYEKISIEKNITQVKKRDGTLVLFNQEKITNAIFKAFKATGKLDKDIIKQLSDEVVEHIKEEYVIRDKIPGVEQIQDLVEQVLIEKNYPEQAKSFILYRSKHADLRRIRSSIVDIHKTMDEYLERSDWRVNENSNVDFSLGGLILYTSGKVTANYWLNKVYPPEIADAHKNGDFHIHDLCMFSGYCAGWSLKQLITMGFGGVKGQLKTVPAKHFDTIIGQMVNFLGTMQNEWAGAQAFSSVDTYLAPFIKYDNLSYKQVKQQMQRLLFNLATPSRWGMQTPFINFTFDWTIPEDIKNEPVIIGGKPQKETYKDFQKEMDMINKAFMECMIEGDAAGRIFTFPIPTYNVTKDFNWDSENANLLFEMTAKYGTPYFQNFINSSLKPTDVRSMCCRLQLSLKDLKNKTGGLFGAGESTGSIGIVTMNMARIGYLAKNKEDYFNRLERLMDLAKESLEIKRKVVEENMKSGLLPYTKRYLGTLAHHFSTVGLNGMNESLLNFMDKGIYTPEGKEFAIEVLNFMRQKITKYQEETGNIYNLEATPAEGTGYRLAKIDRELYPEIITAGNEEPYYTNSTQLPVNYTDDLFEALEMQDEIQCAYNGGTVLHGFVGEKISDTETCKQLVKRIAYNYHLPYFSITPTFSVCPDHGYIAGEHFDCTYENCKNKCEVYSRVVGYYRPIQHWNLGKKEEYKHRKVYIEEKSIQSPHGNKIPITLNNFNNDS